MTLGNISENSPLGQALKKSIIITNNNNSSNNNGREEEEGSSSIDSNRVSRSRSALCQSRAVVNKFFSLRVKNIQDERNNVSKEYRIFWSLKPITNLMREYDLSVTYGDARRELQRAFELFEPITIHGRILDCYYPGNLLIAATIQHSIDNSMNPLLTIYAKLLK